MLVLIPLIYTVGFVVTLVLSVRTRQYVFVDEYADAKTYTKSKVMAESFKQALLWPVIVALAIIIYPSYALGVGISKTYKFVSSNLYEAIMIGKTSSKDPS